MSGERINLAELRDQAERRGVYVAGDGQPSMTFADWAHVLALVEAVEAARDVANVFDCRCDEAWTGRGLHDPSCVYEDGEALRAAFARFDFGDET